MLFFSSSVFSQGPVDGFFKGKGNLDLALSGFYQNSAKFYDGNGLIDYERTLAGASLFGEYGILENLDVITTIPFINGRLQDGGIYLKYRLFRKKFGEAFPLSVIPAIGISFPLSNYQTETSQSIGQKAIQVQPKLVLQYQTKFGLFFQAQGGYNYALLPVPSSIPISGKIGFFQNKFYADMWFDYQKGIGGKAWHVDPISSFRELFVTYSKIGGVIYYGIKPRFGFFVNGSYILSGVNLGKAFSIGGGMVYKFSFIAPTYK